MAGLEEIIRWPVGKAGAGVTWELCYNAGDLSGFFCSLKQDLFSSLRKDYRRKYFLNRPHLEGRQAPQASSAFWTPTAGSLQSWDRRVRPRLVCAYSC